MGNPQGVGRSLAGLATVALQQARLDDAESLFNEALPLLREVNDLNSVATIIANLGVLSVSTGDYARARAAAEEAQQIWRVLGDPIGIANAVGNLGEIAFMEGDLDQARTLFLDALARYEEDGVQRIRLHDPLHLGVIAELEGRINDAWASYSVGLEGSIASNDRVGTTDLVAAFAGLHAATEPEDAARWIGSAYAERDRLGAAPNSRILEDRARQRAILLAKLDQERLDQLFADGALLPIGDAIAAVRAVSARRSESAASDHCGVG